MPCPLCGDICRCLSLANYDANSAASPRWLPDAGASPDPLKTQVELELPESEAPALLSAEYPPEPNQTHAPTSQDSPAWRDEVTARLNRYQARRKSRPPRYPSLRLRFEAEDPIRASNDPSIEAPAFSQTLPTASNQALALNSFASHAAEAPAPVPSAVESQPEQLLQHATLAPVPTAKIIEFPRSWTPTPAPLDELAEPVTNIDRPRILEAPEAVPPPPALGGITIEPTHPPEMERRPGIDYPLQSAPLPRRILAAAIDGVIIAAASALFGFIFWKMTAIRPPRFQIMGLASGLTAVFWAAYQYLLVVYSGTTPGLRLARIELAHFDGRRAHRRLRRWRVLASFLSAASLGMGYGWVFLDEDALCWHDRITHTYLAPKKP